MTNIFLDHPVEVFCSEPYLLSRVTTQYRWDDMWYAKGGRFYCIPSVNLT